MTAAQGLGDASLVHRGLSWRATLAFSVAFLVLVEIGGLLTIPGSTVSRFWPVAGLAQVWLLVEKPSRRILPMTLMFVLNTVVLVIAPLPAPLVVAGACGIVVQSWLAVSLYTRWCPELFVPGGQRYVNAPRLVTLGTVAGVIGCLLGASVWSAGLALAGEETGPLDFIMLWARQITSSMLVGALVWVSIEKVRGEAGDRLDGGGRRELGAVYATSAAVLALAFGGQVSLVFLVVPLAVWSAIRFSTAAATVHAAALGIAALALTMVDRGPFATIDDPGLESLVTQVFMLAVLFASLAVGTLSDRIGELLGRSVADRRRADAQADLLTGMTESMSEGLVVLDRDGTATHHNAAAVRLARRHLPGDDDAALQVLVRLLTSDATRDPSRPELGANDVLVPLPGGGELVLAVVSRPLRVAGSLGEGLLDVRTSESKRPGAPDDLAPGTLLVIHDVTAHRSGVRSLMEFAGTAAHDLRGPLTAMSTWLELVEDSPAVVEDDEVGEAIERVRRSVAQMDGLIEDLLTHATAQGSHVAADRVELAGPSGVLADVADLLQTGERLSVDADLPAVRADPVEMRQLFANLVGNGVKYAPVVEEARVDVTGRRSGERVVVEVRDHGVGVAKADRHRIFERFERGATVTPTQVGSGLGLALCRTIVERHGGMIECVAPACGPGAVFRFDLPADLPTGRPSGLSSGPSADLSPNLSADQSADLAPDLPGGEAARASAS